MFYPNLYFTTLFSCNAIRNSSLKQCDTLNSNRQNSSKNTAANGLVSVKLRKQTTKYCIDISHVSNKNFRNRDFFHRRTATVSAGMRFTAGAGRISASVH